MSTTTATRARQFPVGRRRYVPVVDAGCGCRPRRPRLLSLPSFLKSTSCHLAGDGKQTAVKRTGRSQYSSSSTSTASFSSSCAATHTSTGYSSAYSSDYYHYGVLPAATKAVAASPARAPPTSGKTKEQTSTNKKKKAKRSRRDGKTAAAGDEGEDGVGVAVEKESCDPRADFRESMVQMVVEMGLCDWDGLRCMLRRLLALNAPRHHAAILTAFAEVCAQIIAAPAAGSQASPKPEYQYWR